MHSKEAASELFGITLRERGNRQTRRTCARYGSISQRLAHPGGDILFDTQILGEALKHKVRFRHTFLQHRKISGNEIFAYCVRLYGFYDSGNCSFYLFNVTSDAIYLCSTERSENT